MGTWAKGRLPRFVVLVLLALVGLQFVFLAVRLAASQVPNARIASALAAGLDAGGWQVGATTSEFGGYVDRHTECIALTQGLGTPAHVGGLAQVMSDGTLGLEGCEPAAAALIRLDAGQSVESTDYFRYWHGYAGLTRPLLAIVGVTGMRVGVTVLLVAAVSFLTVLLSRRFGWPAPLAVLGPLALGGDAMAWPLSVTHAIAWSVVFLGMASILWAFGRWGPRGLAAAAVFAGAAYAFVDLLTNPPAALMLTAAAALAASATAAVSLRRGAMVGVVAATGWVLGYAVTWATKWIVSVPILGYDTVREHVAEQIAYRLAGASEIVIPEFGAASRVNVQYWIERIPFASVTLVVTVIIVAASLLYCRATGSGRAGWIGLFAVLALVPPVWFELVSNHSQIHNWFTYLALPATCSVLLLGAVVAVRYPTARTAVQPVPAITP